MHARVHLDAETKNEQWRRTDRQFLFLREVLRSQLLHLRLQNAATTTEQHSTRCKSQ